MSLFAIMKLAGLAADELIQFLNGMALRFPDVAPKAQELAGKLNAPVSQENLVKLASVLPAEIANIAQGKIDPRDHPSDSI